jgi:hypothetical protein
MLPINYLVYIQKQDIKCKGMIIHYAYSYNEACLFADKYIYDKKPLSVIKYNGNIEKLIPLSVSFLLKHKRDLDNDYGYYLMNIDGINEWCFVQDVRPLEYLMFEQSNKSNNENELMAMNTLYPILDYEMYDTHISNNLYRDISKPQYIVYIHFTPYSAGAIIGLSNDYSIAKGIALKFIKDKLSPYTNKVFIMGEINEINEVPQFFLNHKTICYYRSEFDNNVVYCAIQYG